MIGLLGCGTPGKTAAPANAPALHGDADVSKPDEPAAPVLAVEDRACEKVSFPEIHSVIVIPKDLFARALAPVVHAACSCSRPGSRVRVVALIRPEDGVVTGRASEDPPVDECMQRTLNGHFEPFELASDCIDCGPKHYGIFPSSTPPPPPQSSRITYPFVLVHD